MSVYSQMTNYIRDMNGQNVHLNVLVVLKLVWKKRTCFYDDLCGKESVTQLVILFLESGCLLHTGLRHGHLQDTQQDH
jgi:hypothetical protein